MEAEKIDLKKIKYNTGQLEGVPKNPRFIKDARFENLKNSITTYPEMLSLREIVVVKKDNGYVCICGNQRLRACRELGIKELFCKVLDADTNPKELRAFTLIDNELYGETDFDILSDWKGFELDFEGIGIEFDSEVGITSEVAVEAKEDDYEMPLEIKTDIVLGDLFKIGEHRLLCGDSTCSDTVAKLMNGEKAGLLLTDPPYNIKFNGRGRKDGFKHKVIENDDLGVEEFEEFIKSFCSILNIINCNEVYVFCNWELSIQLSRYYNFKQCLCVIKNHIGMGAGYRKQTELCLYKGDFKSTTHSDILTFTKEMVYSDKYKVPVFATLHPTQKPITLVSELINNSSQESNIVLDLFLGSGSTMVASHQLNRKCYGMELDAKYCQVIIDRMLKLQPDLVITKNGIAYIN